MRVLGQVAKATDSFVCGIDHFGKNIDHGTRGSSTKEASADLILACLGQRELTGRVLNLRSRRIPADCTHGNVGLMHHS
jgi:hypothetical protein